MTETTIPSSIFVDIYEWRDRTYGNTYYSADFEDKSDN